MRLITAHRILIGAAIVFFLFYALLRLSHYLKDGGGADLAHFLVSGAIAVGLMLYYRTLARWGRPS
ncbi:MAG: hypothetical protein HY727_10420 [Candidatus Rokubacteria bacterium]|nr:hypothetical protein [Candidatus Rokubacteria bacterium]